MPGYARSVDVNQAEIVDALRQVGVTVTCIHSVGHGCPDLLCGHKGKSYVLEVKNGNSKLTADEREWHAEWRGQVAIVRTPEEAIRVIFGERQ